MSGPSTFQPQNPVLKWFEQRLPIMGLVHSSFVAYPTPRNLNYWWTFGGILSFMLAAQIVNTDWIPQSDDADTADYAYTNICKRARGAFAFTSPNGYHSYNTDLMGGALRALCKTYHAAVTSDAHRCHVNMRFTVDSPWLTVRSSLPAKGRLDLQTRNQCDLFVRLPEGSSGQKVDLNVAGKPQSPEMKQSEIAIGNTPANTAVTVSLDMHRRQTQEGAPGYTEPFEVEWLGDTIVAMRPTEGQVALY